MFECLGKLSRKVSKYPIDLENNYVITNESFDSVYDVVKTLDLDKTKKLKAVEKSRVTINTDFIKSNCYDEINEEVDAYNVTEAETVYVKAIVNGVPFLEYTNNHNLILN